MEQQKFYLTKDGEEKLRRELEELRGPKRRELAKRLKNAVEMGDLSENADYIKAKEDQAFLEGRIQELETVLRYATIVDKAPLDGRIHVGSTVTIAMNGHPADVYTLVGVKEANPREGKISHESPIGKALIGKSAGETTYAETPSGQMELKILEVN